MHILHLPHNCLLTTANHTIMPISNAETEATWFSDVTTYLSRPGILFFGNKTKVGDIFLQSVNSSNIPIVKADFFNIAQSKGAALLSSIRQREMMRNANKNLHQTHFAITYSSIGILALSTLVTLVICIAIYKHA